MEGGQVPEREDSGAIADFFDHQQWVAAVRRNSRKGSFGGQVSAPLPVASLPEVPEAPPSVTSTAPSKGLSHWQTFRSWVRPMTPPPHSVSRDPL